MNKKSTKNDWETSFDVLKKKFFSKTTGEPSKKIFPKKKKNFFRAIDSPYEISHIGVVLNKKIRAAKPRGLRLVGEGLGKGLGIGEAYA